VVLGAKTEAGVTQSKSGLCKNEERNFLFFTAPRPDMGPTQPPIQLVPESLSPE